MKWYRSVKSYGRGQYKAFKKDVPLNLIFVFLLILTVAICGFFINAISQDFQLSTSSGFSWQETGQVGDFFGGIVGTLVSALGFIFVFFSFKKQIEGLEDQRKEIKKQDERYEKSQLENRFIELIKLHKENLSDIEYERGGLKLKGRKMVDFIFNQVLTCYHEISPFFENVDIERVYRKDYLGKRTSLNNERRSFDLFKLAHLDIAYSIVFFGASYNDLSVLSRLFSKYYNEDFISEIAEYIHLKPFDANLLKYWDKVKVNPLDVLSEHRQIRQKTGSYVPLAELLMSRVPTDVEMFFQQIKKGPYEKYYGGHQYKLGQYFRHLFQTVKYINEHPFLKYNEKYNYIKTLRAQLSTIEQYLLFFNSLSFMGTAWELEHVKHNPTEEEINQWLFTKYNFIKNLPDLFLEKEIDIAGYYPELHFEFEREPVGRESLKAKFS